MMESILCIPLPLIIAPSVSYTLFKYNALSQALQEQLRESIHAPVDPPALDCGDGVPSLTALDYNPASTMVLHLKQNPVSRFLPLFFDLTLVVPSRPRVLFWYFMSRTLPLLPI
jgi:hypothetical protein